ncbi:glucose dehydrogenase [Rhodobacterales bacterium HKCCE2091]|nr:glucose dehydrogenase [Rhodobacterales bacterium HKCCE2091]
MVAAPASPAETAHSHGTRPNWAIIVLGCVLILMGLVITAGGVWLIALGGSWYYAPAGIGLLVTGLLLFRGRRAAVPLYLLVWLATLAWAFWEVGTDWWAQVPRLVAPTVVLLLVLLCLPGLTRTRHDGDRA